MDIRFARIGPVSIEYRWTGKASQEDGPVLVFLHEGLGSVDLWKDSPDRLCAALGARGLVYSRPGYGRSTPRAHDEHWGPDFMHRQARELLPALLAAVGLDAARTPPWLFGHSDGGTIALLHAAAFPEQVAGVIALAPHVLVEEISVRSIEAAVRVYDAPGPGSLRARLSRFHEDVDSAFGGWSGAWLSPAFRHWNITGELGLIRCPVLAIQGDQDEYGTMAQIEAIVHHVPGTQVLALQDCGHSPHRDQPQAVADAVVRFVKAGGQAHA